ncbi:MAG: hypothetical protein E7406_01665 [Ruminococcaceae bacterium]|nr:hypothetical protein [Oscillospiraceae bacterium]
MKNYICLGGKKIELTAEQVAEMQKSLGIGQVKLKNIPIGETFKVGDYEFVVLDRSEETTAVILKDLLHKEKQFGKNNNFENSHIDEICKKFSCEISAIIGENNLIEHTVDLTSDDGLKDYGKIKRKMSLLTANLYRRYVEILDKHKIKAWWWLATAYSTPTHENANWVKCVSPDGCIYSGFNYDGTFGVRPFCILNSNIFVSR